jgi:hypothetical protein
MTCSQKKFQPIAVGLGTLLGIHLFCRFSSQHTNVVKVVHSLSMYAMLKSYG